MAAATGDSRILSLFELNTAIRTSIELSFDGTYWVTAEIAELKCNIKGHCFLDLVEKRGERTIAQARATIWSSEFNRISKKFHAATGEALKGGMRILFLVSVSFHEVYGLSLRVSDLDPTYTLGEMARKKREVIERLRREGIIDLNRVLPLPLVPQRIAVVSSAAAAGYGDFLSHIEKNAFGYRFAHALFPALMQGAGAEESVLDALRRIVEEKRGFDVVVIIRGGGSVIDLGWFDSYAIASRVARFPLPVITGIGHERDETVTDMVAHTRLKTPTAVAEFLIGRLFDFEQTVLALRDLIRSEAVSALREQRDRIKSLGREVLLLPAGRVAAAVHRLDGLGMALKGGVRRAFTAGRNRHDALEQAVRHLDPENVLKRGYSITRHGGMIIRDASLIARGNVIATRFSRGSAESIVERLEGDANGQKGETAQLLPGLEGA